MSESTAFDRFVAANFPAADRHLKGAMKRAWDHAASGAGDDELFERVLEMEKKTERASSKLTATVTINLEQEARIQELQAELDELRAASEAEDTDNTDTDAPVSHEG